MVDDFSTSNVVEVELVSLERFTSKIWKYFGFLGKNGQYKRKHDEVMYCNVTNIAETHLIIMSLQLSSAHPTELASMEKMRNV